MSTPTGTAVPAGPQALAPAPFKDSVRTPETPGDMAAFMTLSQVTTPNSSRKVIKFIRKR